jgi:stress response protein YsnF
MTSEPELPPVVGAIADDREGKPLGTVTAVFVDDVTGRPTWVGLTDGTHAAPDATDVAIVAPIADARLTDGRLRLAVSADAVHSAPRPGAPDRLSPAEEVTLHEHYAGGTSRAGAGNLGTGRTDTELIRTDASGAGYTGTDRVGHGAGDGTMTRSEERLSIDSVTEPWARAVLRIEEVTEEVMVPVTITRQQARIEYLPLRAGDRTAGAAGTDTRAGRTGGWVTLYSEQPVVTLERTPVERVRLTTSWVSEEMPITDQLRHEEIEVTTDAPLR